MRIGGRAFGVALLVAAPMQTGARAQLRGTNGEGAAPPPVYRIKPSEVPVPAGAKPGEVRRLIQPFGTWTLICDENLKARTRVCNVAQTFVDEAGTLVFSWSLAATRGGTPVFILRAPVAGQQNRIVFVAFSNSTIPVFLRQCDAKLCLGFTALTVDLRKAIAAGSTARIRFADWKKSWSSIDSSFVGLAESIESIK